MTPTSSTLTPAPRVTAHMLEAVTRHRLGVLVLDEAAGTVYPLPHGLTTAQADDPAIVVLLDNVAAVSYLEEAGTRAAAARLATLDLADQHMRGLL